jgi:hypothetical protein
MKLWSSKNRICRNYLYRTPAARAAAAVGNAVAAARAAAALGGAADTAEGGVGGATRLE